MRLIVFYIAICYFVIAHTDTPFGWPALLAGAIYLFVQLLPKKWPTILLCIVYCLLIAFHFEQFQQELRLIINEWIQALNNFGIVLPLQETTYTSATFSMSFAFLILAICLNNIAWPFVLALTLCLPFFLQAPINLYAVYALFASALLLQMKKRSWQLLYFVPMSIIVVAASPFEQASFLTQAGQKIEQTITSIRYAADNEAQLTNGDFHSIQPISQSAEPAFRIAMEEPRPIYLKSFVGGHFNDGWLPNSIHAPKNADLVAHLKEQNHFETTQLAQASDAGEQTVSIEHVRLSKATALIPYELASPIEDYSFKQNQWASDRLFGQNHYSYSISKTAYYEYPQVAEKVYAAAMPSYLRTEAAANYLNYDAYTAISDEERVLLSNHFGPSEHTSFEKTIQAVQASVSTLTYDKAPATINGDFLKTLLEENKVGHSVHYATLGTLLFRYHGVAARYVEGYIVTNEDIKNAAGRNELTIPFKNQHAWTEIYIDQIGWIPIELTPGYIEKMPETVQSTFDGSTHVATPNTQQQTNSAQVKDDFIPEEPPIETKNVEVNWPWELLLVVILLCIVGSIMYIASRLNKVNLLFKRFVRKNTNKVNAELPLHQFIKSLNNTHAQSAYNLYNEIMYLHGGRYTKAQLKQLRHYLKLARKSSI